MIPRIMKHRLTVISVQFTTPYFSTIFSRTANKSCKSFHQSITSCSAFQSRLSFAINEKAVSSIYGIYAIIVDQVPRYQSLYDSLWEPKQKEEEILEEQKLQIEDNPSAKRRYHFSKSEFVALGSMAAGVLFLLARVYLSFVV